MFSRLQQHINTARLRAISIVSLLSAVCAWQNLAIAEGQMKPIALQSAITSVQPMTGLVLWSSNPALNGKLGDMLKLEFAYLTYADVTTADGGFDWTKVDALLSQASARGNHMILRFRYTYPGYTKPSVPAFIASSTKYQTSIIKVEGQDTFVPDWSSPALQQFTLDFIRAFAQRYNADKRLLLVQLGFGSYAEYHLYDGEWKLGQTFPSKAFQTEFLTLADAVLTRLPWAISIDAANPEYAPIAKNFELRMLNYGVFDDSLMHKNHSKTDREYNRASWLLFGKNRGIRNILGGEISYYSQHDQQQALNLPKGGWGRSFESFASQYQLSYVIADDQPQYQNADRIKQASMSLGYQFEVTDFRCDQRTCNIIITNNGVAPIYHHAFATINGVRSNTSLRLLRPGKNISATITGVAAPYTVTIESDQLLPGQKIEFVANLK